MVIGYLICFLLNSLTFGLPATGVLVFYFRYLHQETFKTKITVLLVGFCYFTTCLLLVLSRICRLPRKPHAKDKPSQNLWDTDLEFTNDSEKVPNNELSNPRTFLKNFLFKNPYEFSIFRPAYGMFLLTALVFLVFAVFFKTIAEEWNDKNDYYCAASVLFPSSVCIIILVYLLSNSPIYSVKPRSDFYVPFHEYVNVPMQVKVQKTVAIFFAAGGTQFVLVLFIVLLILLGIAVSDTVCELSDEALETVFHGFSYKPHQVIQIVLASPIVACIFLLIQMILSASVQAKHSILATMEKNWERNLVAIQFILQDTNCENLQSVREALDIKGNGELTKEDCLAFRYITVPLWWSKQPFSRRWHKAVPQDVPPQRLEEDIHQREQAVQEDPAPVEQAEQDNVEEEPNTESSNDENAAVMQEEEEASEQQSGGYDLRRRRPAVGEQSAEDEPVNAPARPLRPRRRQL